MELSHGAGVTQDDGAALATAGETARRGKDDSRVLSLNEGTTSLANRPASFRLARRAGVRRRSAIVQLSTASISSAADRAQRLPLIRCRRAALRAALAISAISLLGLVPATNAAASSRTVSDRADAGAVVLANPKTNLAAEPIITGARCSSIKRPSGITYQCDSPCANAKAVIANTDQGLIASAACTDAALAAINRAHAAEHVRALVLPSDWNALTVAEQLFAVTDLERVDRGLAPYVGLVPTLDAAAQIGARSGADPVYALSAAVPGPYTSNWAGDIVSPLVSDYEWMYTDGWGDIHYNLGCTTAHAAACWDHRDAILGRGTGFACTDCLMGAAFVATAKGWMTSYAEIFVAPGTQKVLVPDFTWKHDVLPYLPARRA